MLRLPGGKIVPEREPAVKFFRSLLVLMMLLAVPTWAAPPQDLITRAFNAYQKGDYQGAVTMLEKHLAAHPDDPNALYPLGLVLDRSERYGEALEALKACLEKCTPEPPPTVSRDIVKNARTTYGTVVEHRAFELINKGQLDEALAMTDQAVAFMPNEPGTHFARGAVLFERWCQTENDNDKAESKLSWSRCREIQPVSATAELLTGINAFEHRDYEQAKNLFLIAQAMRPNNRYATMWLGLTELSLGNLDAALEKLQDSQKLFPLNPTVYLYIANVYSGQGKWEEAEQQYRKAIELNPNYASVHASLAEMARQKGQADVAADEYLKAVNCHPENYYYRLRLATILHEAGRNDEAAREFLRCRELPGISPMDRARADLERALVLLEKGDRPAAVAAFPENEEALVNSKQGTDPLPRYFLYRAYVGNHHEDRLKWIRKALDYAGPDARELHADAFLAWAELETSRNQRLRALEMLYQSWRRTPPNSARARWIQERFESTRNAEISRTEKQASSLAPLALIDPIKFSEKSSYLNRCLDVMRTAQLGEPGDLMGTRPGTEVVRTLIPADVDGTLATDVKTAMQEQTRAPQSSPWDRPK